MENLRSGEGVCVSGREGVCVRARGCVSGRVGGAGQGGRVEERARVVAAGTDGKARAGVCISTARALHNKGISAETMSRAKAGGWLGHLGWWMTQMMLVPQSAMRLREVSTWGPEPG